MTKAELEKRLSAFAVTIINMADRPTADNDARLKAAVRALTEALAK